MRKSLVIFMAAMMMVGGLAFGVSSSDTVILAATVPQVLHVELADATNAFTFTTTGATTMTDTITDLHVATVTVKTNDSYDLDVSATNWTLDSVAYTLDITTAGDVDVTAAMAANTTDAVDGTTDTTAATGNAGLTYKLKLNMGSFDLSDHTAGTYNDTITVAITAD